MKHWFSTPVEMIIEKDAVRNHKDALRALGTRAFIVTTPSAARTSGALADVTDALSGIPFDMFCDVEQNPSFDTVKRAADKAREAGSDFFIGIGGGSALDAVKVVSLLAADPTLTEDDCFSGSFKTEAFPIAVVGTTAGTGSEVTPYAVLIASDGRKKTVRGKTILPRIALGDAAYLTTMPDAVLRSTALDAVCHAFESWFNKKANAFSEVFAKEALKTAIPVLETISAYGTDGLDEEDYEALYLSSILAGYAISVTGTAMAHTGGYFLSERYGIPHGIACALLLPAFLMHNTRHAPSRGALLYDELCRTEEEMRALVTDVMPSVTLTLTEEEIASLAPRWENNPSLEKCLGTVTGEYMETILKALFVG